MVLRKHLERLALLLERLGREPRRPPPEGLVTALLSQQLQSFATEWLQSASLQDHAQPEDVEASALHFLQQLQLELRMEEVKSLLRSFLSKSQFHGTSVYRQNETFVTLSSGGPMLWTEVRGLFKEIGEDIRREGNVRAAMGGPQSIRLLRLLRCEMTYKTSNRDVFISFHIFSRRRSEGFLFAVPL